MQLAGCSELLGNRWGHHSLMIVRLCHQILAIPADLSNGLSHQTDTCDCSAWPGLVDFGRASRSASRKRRRFQLAGRGDGWFFPPLLLPLVARALLIDDDLACCTKLFVGDGTPPFLQESSSSWLRAKVRGCAGYAYVWAQMLKELCMMNTNGLCMANTNELCI